MHPKQRAATDQANAILTENLLPSYTEVVAELVLLRSQKATAQTIMADTTKHLTPNEAAAQQHDDTARSLESGIARCGNEHLRIVMRAEISHHRAQAANLRSADKGSPE